MLRVPSRDTGLPLLPWWVWPFARMPALLCWPQESMQLPCQSSSVAAQGSQQTRGLPCNAPAQQN